MRTLISADAYHSPDVLRRENERLFRRVWQFIGLQRDLANHHDFVTRTIAGLPLMVQNFHGELRAFVNVCSHRFSQIHDEPQGNRPLQCLYHGWAYNSEGVPVGIPDRPRFDDLTPETLCSLKLTRWQVAVVGQLVFVAAPEVSISLPEFLGPAEAQVAAWSSAFGSLIDVIDLTFRANWKVALENTLESYHIPLVHPTTFSWLGSEQGTNVIEGRHSSFSRSVTPATNKNFEKVSRLFAQRPVKVPDYRHQLVFPNLTLATTWGATFSLQLFEPLDPNTTRFTSLVFSTKVDPQNVPEEWLVTYGRSAAEFNRKVFDEDKIACERVQRGVVGALGEGILSDEESRVGAFHQQYQASMS